MTTRVNSTLPKGAHSTVSSSDGLVHVDTLENGVRVASYPGTHLGRAHVGVGMRAGPRHEDIANWGRSHIVEHMVFRGTENHADSHAVSLAADAWGGDLEASTWRDRMLFESRVDPGAIDSAISLLSDMWLRPKFEGLDIERSVLREEFLEALDDDGQMIDIDTVAMANAFARHSVGKSIEGTLDALEAVTRSDVVNHWKSLVCGVNVFVVGAGALAHRELVDAATRAFGHLPAGTPPALGAPATGRRKRVREVRTEQSQTTLRLGFQLPGTLEDAGTGARKRTALIERILDDGPAARLQEIVDREGLAYEVWADVDTYDEGGLFDFGAQVAHDRVGVVVDRLLREARRLCNVAIADEELDRTKRRVKRDLRDLNDEPEGACDVLFRHSLRGEIFDPNLRNAAVEATTPEDLAAHAASVFSGDQAMLTLVGRPTRGAIAAAERAMEKL